MLGFGQKLLDLALEALEFTLGAGVAHGGVFAGVGEDFGAVDGNGDLADFEEFATGSHFQNLGEGLLEESGVFPSKGTEGIVVWVGVGAKETDGDIAVGGGFYLATGKSSDAVGIDQEGQKHGGRVLLVSGAAMVDVGAGGVDRLDGVDDEVDEVPGWYPVAQVRRKKHRGVAVDSNKSCHINLHSKN